MPLAHTRSKKQDGMHKLVEFESWHALVTLARLRTSLPAWKSVFLCIMRNRDGTTPLEFPETKKCAHISLFIAITCVWSGVCVAVEKAASLSRLYG